MSQRNLLKGIAWRISCAAIAFAMFACASSAPVSSRGAAASQKSFWGKVSDHVTERQCSVYRFSCPYGFGPAGEPCDCTDPRGFVIQGITIK